jgi:hypothetical protein
MARSPGRWPTDSKSWTQLRGRLRENLSADDAEERRSTMEWVRVPAPMLKPLPALAMRTCLEQFQICDYGVV